MSVRKVVNTLDKNLLLLNYKGLVPERVGFLFCLRETSYASRNSGARALILSGSISVINKLPSLNCGHCGVNQTRFDEFIAHFILVVIRVLRVLWCGACFGQGNRLFEEEPMAR